MAQGGILVRFLGVHPGPLLYSRIFLRLEPLGLELVAEAARRAGHTVQLIDLQVEDHSAYFRLLETWRPDVVAFSCNYLANVPEIVDLAKATKARFPDVLVCVGGHSASFTASAIIEHGEGTIDCVLKGEGEAVMPLLIDAIEAGNGIGSVPGAVTAVGEGPAPEFVHSLDELMPARVLQRLDFLRPQLSAGEPAAGCRGSAIYPRTRRLHRRRRRVRPRAPWDGDRRGDRTRRHPQALLPRDPGRRLAAQQGGVPALATARSQDHISRPRSDRRGGASEIPQTRLARAQFRSDRIRPVARGQCRN